MYKEKVLGLEESENREESEGVISKEVVCVLYNLVVALAFPSPSQERAFSAICRVSNHPELKTHTRNFKLHCTVLYCTQSRNCPT